MKITEIVGVLSGMMIAIALVSVLFSVSISPLMEMDNNGLSSLQTKSGTYTHGFTLKDLFGTRTQRPYTPAHIVMLPAVDAQIDANMLGSIGPSHHRQIWIFPELTFRRVGPSITDTASNTTNAHLWTNHYLMTLASIQNKSLTLSSWNRLDEGFSAVGDTSTLWNSLQVYREGLNLMVNGEAGRTNILFYAGNQPDRLLHMYQFGGVE